ncbi:MAG: response regulator [Alphaproteobacteria bacterium]|nr:response regulator [Alphaproteobacteria bacterium]
MIFRKTYIICFLSYLPGLFVLVVSMIALHASLLFIEDYNDILLLQQHRAVIGQNASQDILFSHHSFLESKLYWSVVALGFLGFILVLLNSDKVRKLRTIDHERQENLSLLEYRLAAMEASSDGIGTISSDGVITYMNHAFMKVYGIDPNDSDSFKGKPWHILYDKEGQKEIENVIMPELDKTGYWHGISLITGQDGGIVHAELSLTRLPDGGIVGTARDITNRIDAENEKEELQGQFYQAQKMEAIGRLVGGVSHDFNNILSAMNGNAEFLIEDLEEGSPEQGFAKNILQAGIQAKKLVDQMLSFSRRKDNDVEHVDLGLSVDETILMLQASLPKTIEVITDIHVYPALISGNNIQISQIIMNLCLNAKDAMEDGKGSLRIGLRRSDIDDYEDVNFVVDDLPDSKDMLATCFEDIGAGRTRLFLGNIIRGQDYIILSVRDQGCGMSRVIMEHIFEPFFTTKPVGKGTGLGLSTVHGVISRNQGALIIDSTIGKGSSFELFFPAAQETSVVEKSVDKETSFKMGGHVHLVEDQEEVRDMTLTMLQRMGFEVTTSSTGLEGLKYLREAGQDVDLVITDHNMPKMTGLEMVVQIHMDYPDLPFILLSGYSEQKLKDLMKEHPAIKTILRKPISRQSLGQKIESVMAAGSKD